MIKRKEHAIPFIVDVFPAIVKMEWIDNEKTKKVKTHIFSNESDAYFDIEEENDSHSLAFEAVCRIFEELLSSDDTQSPYYVDQALSKDQTRGLEILNSFKLRARNFIAFSLHDDDRTSRRYWIFYFSRSVLLFLDPNNRPVLFLCALKPNAITLSFYTETCDIPVTIREKSREPIEYYKKFNPLPDSQIRYMHWEATNHDGSRSFRGGLKPENNPLHFGLEYGIVTLGLCGAKLQYGFSNSDLAKRFSDAYLEYLKADHLSSYSNVLEQEKIYNDALSTVRMACIPPRKKFSDKFKKAPLPVKFMAVTFILLFVLLSLLFLLLTL